MGSKSRNGNKSLYFNVHFPTVIAVSCALPLSALFFCEAWSIYFDFKKTTATSCSSRKFVKNFLPSISEATGSRTPQRYVWQIFIALHSTPRFIITNGYRHFHKALFASLGPKSIYTHLATAAYALQITEILTLVGLSYVPSTDNYEIHEFCFVTFMVCATLQMLAMCVLSGPGKYAVVYVLSAKEKLSLKLKKIFLTTNISFFAVAVYFFYRHNQYCEDGVYSLFALCEVIVVVTNIGFHGTAMLDFSDSHVLLQDFPDR